MITPPGLPPGCPPWFARPAARAWTCAPAPTAGIRAFHTRLPGYAPTPLTEVPAIAAELGVGRVFVKDESARMGLAAFKVLGASWAVHQVLSRRHAAGPVTLVAATDGNHGRALAWMARLLGQRAHVFVPSGVHPTAVAAIAAEGAQVTEITGSYDDAVRLAAKAAREPGAELVQDAGWPGYEEVPAGSSTATRPCSPRSTSSSRPPEAAGARPGSDPGGSRVAGPGRHHPLPEPATLRCDIPADGRARLRRRRPGQPGPRRARHRRDRGDHHVRAQLRHSLQAGLALPARRPGRGGRRGQRRGRRGSSRPGGLRDTSRPVRRGLAGRGPGRADRRGRAGAAGRAGCRSRRHGRAAEHRRSAANPVPAG